uniref:Uncharacterized protein n=1 Tax=Tupiella akineta TaxID=160070 RepID=Q3ZJ34_TUPAK|nr:hypothetical protein PsakCp059 [Tupiella akineta]AAV80655.1 hypothetical protein [Tupiella akineta]
MRVSLAKSVENFKICQEALKNLPLILDQRNCPAYLPKKNQTYFLKKKAKNEEKDTDFKGFANNEEHKKKLRIYSSPEVQLQMIAKVCLLILREKEKKRVQLLSRYWVESYYINSDVCVHNQKLHTEEYYLNRSKNNVRKRPGKAMTMDEIIALGLDRNRDWTWTL